MRTEINLGTLKVLLDWDDIHNLKEGRLVAERYNGEHKCNISCVPESLFAEDWLTTASVPPRTEFNKTLHDFFIEIPVFDIRNQFISSTTFKLCPNPFFEQITIMYPG